MNKAAVVPAAAESVASGAETSEGRRHLNLVELDPLLSRVLALGTEGMSQVAIALEIGKSATTVARLEGKLRAKGYKIQRARGRPQGSQNGSGSAKQRYDAEQRAKADAAERERADRLARWIESYEDDLSCETIAEREREATGAEITAHTVWRSLKNAERQGRVELRPPGRPCGFDGDRAQLPALVLDNYDGSTPRVADDLGISQSFAYNLLVDSGGQVLIPRPRRSAVERADHAELFPRLYLNAELSLVQVGRHVRRSPITVLRDLDSLGVARRPFAAGLEAWWSSPEGLAERGRRQPMMRGRWKSGDVSGAMLAFASGPSISRWLGTWKLAEIGHLGPGKKGEKEGRETAAAALWYLERRPDLELKQLIDLLIVRFRGSSDVKLESGERRTGRDAVYRKARAVILRRLQRGYKELGEPSELQRLLA